jgi:hypothetical protein
VIWWELSFSRREAGVTGGKTLGAGLEPPGRDRFAASALLRTLCRERFTANALPRPHCCERFDTGFTPKLLEGHQACLTLTWAEARRQKAEINQTLAINKSWQLTAPRQLNKSPGE